MPLRDAAILLVDGGIVSKYMIDKLLRAIDASDSALEAFLDDPVAFMDRWEAAGRDPVPPFPVGGTLTDEERAAFATWDYERLYVLGAHPYLLWMLLRSLYEADGRSVEALVAEYSTAIGPHGYPGYTD